MIYELQREDIRNILNIIKSDSLYNDKCAVKYILDTIRSISITQILKEQRQATY